MSRSKIVKISQLRIGQRFSFIPSDWFGPNCVSCWRSWKSGEQKSWKNLVESDHA